MNPLSREAIEAKQKELRTHWKPQGSLIFIPGGDEGMEEWMVSL